LTTLRSGALVTAVLMLCAANHASAYELLTIPFSAAMERHDDSQDRCAIQVGINLSASTPTPDSCLVDIPIMVPAGRTIDQIWIMHGDQGFYPNPIAQASLQSQETTFPFNNNIQFIWSDSSPHGSGVFTDHIMSQAGKLFPDAFVVQNGTIYHVVVRLYNGASFYGLEVRYE
jgi:hypothetical protein